MTLIKSISGIRGTIGGKPGDCLTPIDVVKFTAAFGTWVIQQASIAKVVVGRDARISGQMVSNLVVNTLIGLGIDVVDLGLSTTPTVEMAVTLENAGGGIIITASHNPKQWNALKLLNKNGEFISADAGATVLALAETDSIQFATVDKLGKYTQNNAYFEKHIDAILKLPYVDVEAITAKNFKIVVDAVNSTGGLAIPMLFERLGVKDYKLIYGEPTGHFPHNPEPLPEHLGDLAHEVVKHKAHLGIAVDPDVDRLVIINEDGTPFGEEYTLVAVADYVLSINPGNTVSNLSSTRALRDVTQKYEKNYYASAVGEVHVVNKMKAVNAVIGGEGNGGVILPELHYGRDALVGIAIFLTQLAKLGKSPSILRTYYPNFHISKNKIELTPEINVDLILERMAKKYADYPINQEDGLRIDFENEWVHLRKSNTEPIIRIYAEGAFESTARNVANKIIADIKSVI